MALYGLSVGFYGHQGKTKGRTHHGGGATPLPWQADGLWRICASGIKSRRKIYNRLFLYGSRLSRSDSAGGFYVGQYIMVNP